MVIPLRQLNYYTIHQSIEQHLAWQGKIRGLDAEKMLREKKIPYLYILRAGETELGEEKDYYVSFLLPDFTIIHQPFIINITDQGWFYEQGVGGGPFNQATSIDDVLHLIMHAHKDEPTPLIL